MANEIVPVGHYRDLSIAETGFSPVVSSPHIIKAFDNL